MKEEKQMFKTWTNLTRTCYARYKEGLGCEGCPNNTNIICNREPWNKNPYGMKNIKYAMLRTLSNIGEPNKNENL